MALIEYRTYRNSDPPALVDLWRSQPALRGRAPLDLPALEQLALAKLYFDPRGLILAEEAGRALGFVHAGFGPTADGTALDKSRGVIAALLLRPHERRAEIAAELLARAEEYLRREGAVEAVALGASPAHPFYLGLYGGAEAPGVLESDEFTLATLRAAGYDETGKRTIYQARLAELRPPVDRKQMQVRRNFVLDQDREPLPANWWEAISFVHGDCRRFTLRPRTGSEAVAEMTCWDIFPLGRLWNPQAMGLLSIRVEESMRRQGLATFLLGEAWRQLAGEGIGLVEAHCGEAGSPYAGLLAKLGMKPVENGVVLTRALQNPEAPA